MKAKARHENAPTMIAAKLDLEYAIKSVEELERLLQVSNRFLPGTTEYQQMELEYSEKNIRTQQGLLWYLVRCRHAERERLYKRIGSYHIFRLNGFQLELPLTAPAYLKLKRKFSEGFRWGFTKEFFLLTVMH